MKPNGHSAMADAAQSQEGGPGILVVDFGSQYTMLIARRLREIGVYSEVKSHAASLAQALPGFGGVILSGGPASVHDDGAPEIAGCLLDSGLPVLGICYGMQALAKQLGGDVRPSVETHGYGKSVARVSGGSALLDGLSSGDGLHVWMSHGDHIAAAPPGFDVVATGESAPVMAMASHDNKVHGLQFHPEVTHTEHGTEILRRFAAKVCGLACDWTMPAFARMAAEKVRATAGKDRILLGLSGGIDSAVAAALIEKAVPGQLVCVLVDHGLMRQGEVEEVQDSFSGLGERLVTVDAKDEFLDALAGIEDPEAKRKAIGRTFAAVFKREADKLGKIPWLAQGTIYPDVIESAGSETGVAAQIKSHHNVGGLPKDLGMGLVEPLRLLFKDEVRQLAKELGLPGNLIGRHPFPGPGMAVRVIAAVSKERLATARAADKVFIDELREAGLYDKVAQAFAVLLPVATVGVQGDGRTYENVIALRAVTTDDFMTADWARLPDGFLARCSSRIINEVRGVNRVVYDISSKPPATVEWE